MNNIHGHSSRRVFILTRQELTPRTHPKCAAIRKRLQQSFTISGNRESDRQHRSKRQMAGYGHSRAIELIGLQRRRNMAGEKCALRGHCARKKKSTEKETKTAKK
ncbi:hypothetical protein PQR62_07995 [Herbaspirillum lusitanum]|uniref:Uncharacterized protein n=1 Tax=Herbaspirillum lusitanum TaxID=213312 RepID=A0ABW9A5N1_9BURK